MRVVSAVATFPGSVHDAESVWYDTSRWHHWVVGLHRVESITGPWPQVGAEVRWRSTPAGRGEVRERVVGYEPLDGQTLEVSDDSIRATQSVSFSPQEENVEVSLRLAYELKQRSVLMALVDLIFIRRAMTRSLEQTLSRFGAELEAAQRPDDG